MPRNHIQKLLFATLLGSMFLTGCGVHNPFCGSARPVPVLNALAPNPASFTQVEQGLLLTVNGSHFYSESIVVHTPPNLAGDLGCDSGGDSQPSTFTVTE